MRMMSVVVVIGTLGVGGCASLQLPTDQVAHYEATVEQARAMGAFKLQADAGHRGPLGLSQSKEHLLLADDEIAVAREMAGRGDTRSALFLARAQSDVDLAIALTREQKARQRQTGTAEVRTERGPSWSGLRNEVRTR